MSPGTYVGNRRPAERKAEANMRNKRYTKRVSGVFQFSRILAPSALTPMGVRELPEE